MTSASESRDLLIADVRGRCMRGERAAVEAIMAAHPAVKSQPETLLDLIYTEVLVRDELGQAPAFEEYAVRFPQFADELRLQFEVHQAIAAASLGSLPSTHSTSIASDGDYPVATVGALAGLPGYDVLRELGRGGMGVVYEAEQHGLKRRVALKMVLAGAHSGPRERARFRTEAEAVARLGHPNIVQVYEVGEYEGRPFLALELLPGGSLADGLAGAPRTPADAATIVAALATALDDAHRHGVVHRDLKPSNVLLAVDGTPKVTDFGLAKLLDAETGPTATDAFLGTPSYAAPEQALGQAKAVGPAADIYSLGAILYECLTGRPPFRGATLLDTLAQVRTREPVPPRRLTPGVPADLETICLKCLEKTPARRYATAADLAADLRRFLASEPVLAQPVPVWRVAVKWARRRPLAAAAVAAMLASVPALAGLFVWHEVDLRAKVQTAEAKVEAQYAEQSERQADREALQTFLDQRDDAMFHGLVGVYDPLRSAGDAAADPSRTAEAARRALATVGIVQAADRPATRRFWSAPEQEEIAADCYQLRLLLADAVSDRPREALRALDAAASLVPPTSAYHQRRARLLERAGDAVAAAAEQANAAARPATTALDFFLRGAESYRRDELTAAVADFERALVAEPNHFWAKFLMAVCHMQLGRWAEARIGLSDCSGHRPRFAGVYLLRATAVAALGDTNAAEADFARALALDASEQFAYTLVANRGAARAGQGRFADAERDLRRALALEPQQYHSYQPLARVCRDTGRRDEALALLDEALTLSLSPAVTAQVQTERAALLSHAGRPAESLAACDAALRLRPDEAETHAVRGTSLLALQQPEPAIAALTRALELHVPKPADVRSDRGAARFQIGDYAGAVADYTVVLESRPSADVFAHRGWAYVFLDAWKLALLDFEAAARLEPASTCDTLVGRAVARSHLGDATGAVADAEAAVVRGPATADLFHNLACAFVQASSRSDSPERAATCRSRAFAMLREELNLVDAASRPAYWRDKVETEPDLAAIRGSAEFAQLGRDAGGRR